MIDELYEHALAGHGLPEIEHADGSTTPLPVDNWLQIRPGDASLVDRCAGPTLDVGSGPGRLTVAIAERGIPALGIDAAPYAVRISRAAGVLTLARDVFGRVPGAGRWMTVLLADGNIGIGGDPVALLRRVGELLTPLGQALVEIQPPGTALRSEQVRFRHNGQTSAWFPWAYVGVDQIAEVAGGAGLAVRETWSAAGRWFTVLRPAPRDGDGVLDRSRFLPRAYRHRDRRTRRPASAVNWGMSYDGNGNGRQARYRGFAGLADAPRQRAPWEDPQQQGAWDAGEPLPAWNARARQSASARPSPWSTTGQELPRRASSAFGAIPGDIHGRPRHGEGGDGPAAARQGRGRGLLAGGIAGFLAAAVALGVAALTAGFVRPQASPVTIASGVLIDRTPPALKDFAVEKFGENGKNMLLLGMYVTIALIAIVIGMLAWRRLSVGVAGIGLFGLFGAFVAITRPESHVTDVIPSIAGGIAGIVAIVLLVRARMPGPGIPGAGIPGTHTAQARGRAARHAQA